MMIQALDDAINTYGCVSPQAFHQMIVLVLEMTFSGEWQNLLRIVEDGVPAYNRLLLFALATLSLFDDAIGALCEFQTSTEALSSRKGNSIDLMLLYFLNTLKRFDNHRRVFCLLLQNILDENIRCSRDTRMRSVILLAEDLMDNGRPECARSLISKAYPRARCPESISAMDMLLAFADMELMREDEFLEKVR